MTMWWGVHVARAAGWWVLAAGVFALPAAGGPAGAAGFPPQEGTIMIPLSGALESNLPKLESCLQAGRFVFRDAAAASEGGESFFIRFGFEVETGGDYRMAIRGRGPGSRGQSRYTWALDGGPARPALCRRVVTAGNGRGYGWHEQAGVELSPGSHVLELRFRPEDRVRRMNRVGEPWEGHAVEIDGIRMEAVRPRAGTREVAPAGTLRLQPGDTVVCFGDSITDEGFYPAHLARLVDAAMPGGAVTIVNAGIALNRTWEGLERIDRDVMALKPAWVILAFGVNDSVHMAPDEFGRQYERLIVRLRGEGIRVLCATPSGMLPALGVNDATYFHAPDRASGFDRTMAYEAAAIGRLAARHGCEVADVRGALCGCGIPRASLMANQWHPNDEGGRVMAISMLVALGLSEEEAGRSGEAKDVDLYRKVRELPPVAHPEFPSNGDGAIGPMDGPLVAASSFSRNEVAFFSAETGLEQARIAVGHHPMGMAYSPKRRRLYVACEGVGRLDVIGLPEGRRLAEIELGDVYPTAVVLSEDESTAWTGNFFGCSLSEVDLESGAVRREIKIDALVEGLMAVPESACLLAATRKGICRVGLPAGTVDGVRMISDHCDAFFRDMEGRIHVIDTVGWRKTALAPADLAVGETTLCAWPSRAVIADVAVKGWWVADWRQSMVVRTDEAGRVTLRAGPVEFPFGMALIPGRNSNSSAVHLPQKALADPVE